MSHGWQTEGDALVSDRQFADFAQAMAYVYRVAALAEEHNHHPDIMIHGWNKVRLTLTTHDAGGTVTDADHAMAEAIDALGPDAS
jgi:4a-hydroxytetrahydrobiopterin dehydratase